MPLFELAYACFNCKGKQWRLGERVGAKTEFICTCCGKCRYFNLGNEQFAHLVGAD